VAWAEDAASTGINEAYLRKIWPSCRRIERLGPRLFVVEGIEPQQAQADEEPLPEQGCPHQEIQALLAAARSEGDLQAEATALTDWGIVLIREAKLQEAVAKLQEALTLTRQLGDRSGEADVLSYLGLAWRNLGQADQAFASLENSLALARAEIDQNCEKTALFHLGLTYATIGQHVQAVTFFERALALARAVNDQRHVTELLWYLSIQHAELGERNLARARAQEVVDLLKAKGDPQAAWFAHHLQRYEADEAGIPTAEPFISGSLLTGAGSALTSPSPWVTTLETGQSTQVAGPGWLRMAFTAAKAMVQFLGSGFKTVSRSIYKERLEECRTCVYHTGVRCRVCGCFTNVKATLVNEACPKDKWPREGQVVLAKAKLPHRS
jgi:tetratricopeptide (TPR) repeat protein